MCHLTACTPAFTATRLSHSGATRVDEIELDETAPLLLAAATRAPRLRTDRDEATLRTRVLAYHKPAGVLVTHDDELNRPTVYDNLPDDDGARWHAVGRLDADTTGLLLLTNDGKLVQHVTDPVANTDGVVKEYRVRCGTALDDDALAQLREGVELSGGSAARSRPTSSSTTSRASSACASARARTGRCGG